MKLLNFLRPTNPLNTLSFLIISLVLFGCGSAPSYKDIASGDYALGIDDPTTSSGSGTISTEIEENKNKLPQDLDPEDAKSADSKGTENGKGGKPTDGSVEELDTLVNLENDDDAKENSKGGKPNHGRGSVLNGEVDGVSVDETIMNSIIFSANYEPSMMKPIEKIVMVFAHKFDKKIATVELDYGGQSSVQDVFVDNRDAGKMTITVNHPTKKCRDKGCVCGVDFDGPECNIMPNIKSAIDKLSGHISYRYIQTVPIFQDSCYINGTYVSSNGNGNGNANGH